MTIHLFIFVKFAVNLFLQLRAWKMIYEHTVKEKPHDYSVCEKCCSERSSLVTHICTIYTKE